MNKISKDEFISFKELRCSGIMNMLSPEVREYCDLTREQHMYIIQHYDELYEEYIRDKK